VFSVCVGKYTAIQSSAPHRQRVTSTMD